MNTDAAEKEPLINASESTLIANDDPLKQEYVQWQTTHAKMKESPPPDGRDYLKHAKILLVLLEGASELHPFAKSVVTSFRTVVMFEQDRRENDARVTAVFLAQTDMMRVLLDVDDLSQRRQNGPRQAKLRSSTILGNLLLEAQKEIKACGNSIDTYYKESRFVKFWKAQDWKDRMLGHIGHFDSLRVQLQQTLSLQVASGVQDLVSKMDVVLSRLFVPKADWEKDLDTKTRGFGASKAWIENPGTLQSLIASTNDPLLPLPTPSAPMDLSAALATDMLLSNVKKDLEQSLDALCERNMDMFELRLNFHAQQMERAIVHSAQFVVQALSGPSERLVNEDLRQLWKEMSWLFCIENKLFCSALFEFYLDCFSINTRRNVPHSKEEEVNNDHSNDPVEKVTESWSLASVPAPKFSFLSRLGSINHPDAWTLEYIARYGDRITKTIDNDDSGFIRISEANAYTEKIPKGWNLPQWCAYSAVGWVYEARIYRRRIQEMSSILAEMQAKVLDSNRTYLVVFSLINFLTVCHAFTREPVDQEPLTLAPELVKLVKQKVLDQDVVCREHLQSLNWTLEDESTVHLLYGEENVENYILQLCTLVLEQYLALVYTCRKVTPDIGDWFRLTSAFRLLRSMCMSRIAELEDIFKDSVNPNAAVAAYRGGIWSYFVKIINKDNPLTSSTFVPYSRKELAESLVDQSLLDDFPVSQLKPAYLKYSVWEDHIKTASGLEESDVIPRSWNGADDGLSPEKMTRYLFASFPFSGSTCDGCGKPFVGKPRHTCLEPTCFDFDMCPECYKGPEKGFPDEIPHKFGHRVAYICLLLMPDQLQRVALEVDDVIEKLQQQYSAQQRSDSFTATNSKAQEEESDTAENQPDEAKAVVDTPAEEKDAEKDDNADGLLQEDKSTSQKTIEEAEGKATTAPETQTDSETAQTDSETEETEKDAEDTSQETSDEPEDKPVTSLKTQNDSGAKETEKDNCDEEDTSPATNDESEEKDTPSTETQNDSGVKDTENGVSEDRSTSEHKRFNCGRCGDPISFDTDFYRCIGHSCQDYYLCEKCVMGERYEAEEGKHQWWHTLLCLRKDMITGNHSDAAPNTETALVETAKETEIPHATLSTGVMESRIVKIEEILNSIHSSHFSLTEKRTGEVGRLEETVGCLKSDMGRLEEKVERLESKMDDMIAALRQLLLVDNVVGSTKAISN